MSNVLQLGDGVDGSDGYVYKANQTDYVANQLAVLSETKAIALYNDAIYQYGGWFYHYKLKALGVAGGVVTVGDEVDWPNNSNQYNYPTVFDIAPISSTAAIAICQNDNPTYSTEARIVTVSDLTVTLGNAAQFYPQGDGDIATFLRIVALSDTKAIALCRRAGVHKDGTYAKVATISGTSISFGSETYISTFSIGKNGTTYSNNIFLNKIGATVPLTSTTALAFGWQTSDGDYTKSMAVVITVSGTSVSFGTPAEVTVPGEPTWVDLTKLSSTKALLTFYYFSGDGQNIYTVVLDVSGTTVTPGDAAQIAYGSTFRASVSALSATQSICFYRRSNGTYNLGYACLLQVTGTDVECGDELQITTDRHAGYGVIKALNSSKALAVFLKELSTTGDDTAIVISKLNEDSIGEDASVADSMDVTAQLTTGISEDCSVSDLFVIDMLADSGMAEESSALNTMIGETTMDVEITEEASASEDVSAVIGESLLILNFEGGDGDSTWAEEAQGLTPDPSVTYGFEIDTAEHKFGVSSLKGAGGVEGGNNFGYELPEITTGDITLHGWVKFKGLSTWASAVGGGSEAVSILYLQPNGGDPDKLPYIDFGLYQSESGDILMFRTAIDQDENVLVNDDVANPFTEDTWHHVAIIVSGRNVMFSVGGVIQATWTATIDDPMAGFHWMQIAGGELPTGADFWADGFELLNYAKWTENFTPPAAPSRGPYYSFSENESLGVADGSSWQFPKSIEDLFFIYDKIQNGWSVTNTEDLTFTDTVSEILCVIISDWLTLVDTQTNNWNGKEIFTDTLNLYDIVSFGKAISDTINESLVIADVATYKLVVGILEHLGFTDLATALKTMAESMSESLILADVDLQTLSFTIQEALSAVDTVSVVATFLRSIADSLAIADTLSNIKQIYGTIAESLVLAESVTIQGTLYSAVYDTIAMNVLVELADDVYECYVLNTPKFMPSMYSGFNFNSYCVFENRAFAANSTGIYELTGTTDAGSVIHSGVVLSNTDFGSPNKKRFRRGYLGISGTSPIMVLETEDGGRQVYTIDDEGKTVFSHDQKSKKWKLSVADFDELESIKLIPIVLSR